MTDSKVDPVTERRHELRVARAAMPRSILLFSAKTHSPAGVYRGPLCRLCQQLISETRTPKSNCQLVDGSVASDTRAGWSCTDGERRLVSQNQPMPARRSDTPKAADNLIRQLPEVARRASSL